MRADYQAMLEQYAARRGIPLDIARRWVGQESTWRPSIVSPKGAVGLTQLMPGTAKDLGVDPYDPGQNLEGGTRYLAQQYKEFGSWPLALAAYNAGPNAVRKYGGVPPFAETRRYLKNVLGDSNPQVAQAGRNDSPQGLLPAAPPQFLEAAMGGQAAPQPGMPAPMGGQPMGGQPPPMGFGDRLGAAVSNPAFLMGASILANNTGNYGAAAPAIGRGLQQGAGLYMANQEDPLQAQLRELQIQGAKAKMAQDEQDARYVEAWVSQLPPEQQRLARAIGIAKYIELISKKDAPVKKYEYTKGGILDTTTGELRQVPGTGTEPPAGYKFDPDLFDVARTDPEKALTIQEQRNKDRTAGVTDQGIMRKEFLQQTEEFRQTEKAAKVLPELLTANKTRNSKAADLALVVQLAKAMDPTSVVREGEVYTIQRQGGLFDALKSYLGYITNQGQLTDAMRQDLAETVMAYYRSAFGSAKEKQAWYRRIAEQAKADPELIVGPEFSQLSLPTTVAPPPPPGFTERVR